MVAYRRRRLIDALWMIIAALPTTFRCLTDGYRQGRIRTAIKARTARREYEPVVKDMENKRLVGEVRAHKNNRIVIYCRGFIWTAFGWTGGPVLPCPALPCLALPCLALPCLALPTLGSSDHIF